MKEIKFKAWYKEQKAMVPWENLVNIRYNERWFLDNEDKNYINCIFTDPDLVLLQFIGLKDKNGKEIYEGDFVYISDNFSLKPYLIRKSFARFEAYAEDSGYGNPNTEADIHNFVLEIIGNIYENPELLVRS